MAEAPKEIPINHSNSDGRLIERTILKKYGAPKTRSQRKQTAIAENFEKKVPPLNYKQRRKLARKAAQAFRKHGKE
jgi:hypothetical protein